MPDAASHPPLVLLANAQEWFSRSLESILRPAGYAVLKVYTASDAMETARRTLPDVLILDTELPDANVGQRTSGDRKSTRLNSSHQIISYAVFCLKKKK